jgi:hypothetical protein
MVALIAKRSSGTSGEKPSISQRARACAGIGAMKCSRS